MSKLNDSTLKILKKYRLDTDMSVFGNENKLYDVVKVMDDMVGNQVSKYVGYCRYADSLTQTNDWRYLILKSGSAINSITYSSPKPNIMVLLDPLSYKTLYVYRSEKGSRAIIGYIRKGSDDSIYAYIGIDFDESKISLYSDPSLTIDLTGTIQENISVYSQPVVIFSDIKCSNTTIYLQHLLDISSYSSNMQYYKITSGIINLPEIVGSNMPNGFSIANSYLYSYLPYSDAYIKEV